MDEIKYKSFWVTLILNIIINFSAAYYYISFRNYSSDMDMLSKIGEVLGMGFFVSIPVLYFFLKQVDNISSEAGAIVNILLSALALYIFYNMLVTHSDISAAGYSFFLVFIYQFIVIFLSNILLKSYKK